MASAYMKKGNDGIWRTTIINSDGDYVKTVNTPKAQIRENRTSLLYTPPIDTPASFNIGLTNGIIPFKDIEE